MKHLALILIFAALARSGWTAAPDRVQLVRTPNGGMVPDAEIDQQGVIHVAYVAGDDVHYAKSSNEGKTFSAPLRVNSEPGTAHPANMFRGPDVALGKDGRVHVIWYSNAYQRKRPSEEWGVMYSHLDAAKTGFVSARNLNHKPSDNYSLAAAGDGSVAVFWMAGGLFYNVSRDNGETFSSMIPVSIADTCECCASRAFFSADGSLHCAYRDKANNLRDMYLLSLRSGKTAFEKNKLSVTPWEINGCPMTGAYLSGTKNGLLTAWQTKGEVFYSRIDPAGRRLSTTEIQTPARAGKWPVALSASDGTTLVSWKSGSTLQWQLYNANDKAQGETKSFPSGNPHRHAGVVTAGGTFLLID